MPRVKIPYYKIRNGRAYFEIGKTRAEDAGWTHTSGPKQGQPKGTVALGKHNEASQRNALALYHQYISDIGGKKRDDIAIFAPGTLGSFWIALRKSKSWARKSTAVREDFERAWVWIEPTFANTRIDRITAATSENFHDAMLKREEAGEISANMRWRTLKQWRSLLKMMEKAGVIDKAPVGNIANPHPPGRSQIWLHAEIMKLITTANANGYAGMALAIEMGWETAMSAVDIRTMPLEKMAQDKNGAWFESNRQKTGEAIYAVISQELHARITKYVSDLGFDLAPSTPFIRARTGKAYDKRAFNREWNAVRDKTFPDDKRQFMDIRRSANVEADIGGASKKDRAALLANSLDRNARLERTYTPATVTKARELARKRRSARPIIARESIRIKNNSGPKV